MRVHLACTLLALIPVSLGCGSSSSTPDAAKAIDAAKTVDSSVTVDAAVDAPPGAFACLGQPLPTTAPDPLVIAGTAKTLSGLSTANAPGVLVAAFKNGSGTALAMATTPADGSFSLSLVTGAVPIDGYVKATKAQNLDYYLYPAAPLSAAVPNAPVLSLSASSLGTIEAIASVTPAANPSTVGLLGLVIQDCMGNPVTGATITVKEGGAEVGDMRYVAGSIPSTTATMTDSKGAAFVFNVPEGTATVSAMVGGMTLRTHTIAIHGGATHATIVAP